MEIGRATQADLARACDISPVAVSKWLTGKSAEIKAVHVFTLARRCNVDAEWLATGRGKPAPTRTARAGDEFEVKHLDLLRMYKRLPPEIRMPIRQMVETLAAAQAENFKSWTRPPSNNHDKVEG